MTYNSNETAESWNYSSGTYDRRVQDILLDVYSSGVTKNSTVSSFFDIQWRQWATRTDRQNNNGSAYLVGSLRQMQSLLLENNVRPIEGLVVDTVNGSIGFRNHTVPIAVQQSVSWTEDLLFVEPETACVDTNLTIDFAAITNGSVIDLELVDHGGFANLNHTYPTWDRTHPETFADLQSRAYKAAWMSNAWTMLYWNITNPRNYSSGQKPFSYLTSEVGKRFPLRLDNHSAPTPFISLQMDTSWQGYLGLTGSMFGGMSSGGLLNTDPSNRNPFKMKSDNFSDISASIHPHTSLSILALTHSHSFRELKQGYSTYLQRRRWRRHRQYHQRFRLMRSHVRRCQAHRLGLPAHLRGRQPLEHSALCVRPGHESID